MKPCCIVSQQTNATFGHSPKALLTNITEQKLMFINNDKIFHMARPSPGHDHLAWSHRQPSLVK